MGINWESLKEKGVERIDGDRIKVSTKDGVFVMRDIAYEKISSARRRNPKESELSIISEMIESRDGKEDRIGELTVGKFRTSTITKLAHAMNLIIDEEGIIAGGDGKDF